MPGASLVMDVLGCNDSTNSHLSFICAVFEGFAVSLSKNSEVFIRHISIRIIVNFILPLKRSLHGLKFGETIGR